MLLEGGSDVAAATEGRLESAAGDLKVHAPPPLPPPLLSPSSRVSLPSLVPQH